MPASFWFYSGKGGVGKTSCAAAAAVHFSAKGKRTLIVSTDPAHSLSDSFEKKIGGEAVEIRKNLFAVEIDPKKAMEEYRERLSPKMEGNELLKGFGLDEGLDLAGNMPGADEMAAFDRFLQFMQSDEYDVVIFDTAPTGHTLRFLSLPDVLDSWVGKMISMRMKMAGLMNMVKGILPFGENEGPDLSMKHLEEMKKRIAEARKILSDRKRTHYNIVTIAEAMSIYESERAWKVLKGYGISVSSVIVNQVVPENKTCKFCSERRRLQEKGLSDIRKKFRGLEIMTIPQFGEEVKGAMMLEKMGKEFL